jgi:hypothetical protein
MLRGMREFVHNPVQVERSFLDEKLVSENEKTGVKRY